MLEKGHLSGPDSLLFKADPSPELLSHTIHTSFCSENILVTYHTLCYTQRQMGYHPGLHEADILSLDGESENYNIVIKTLTSLSIIFSPHQS